MYETLQATRSNSRKEGCGSDRSAKRLLLAPDHTVDFARDHADLTKCRLKSSHMRGREMGLKRGLILPFLIDPKGSVL